MTPEDLIGYGVSAQFVAHCMAQLNYPIPSALAHLAPRSTAAPPVPISHRSPIPTDEASPLPSSLTQSTDQPLSQSEHSSIVNSPSTTPSTSVPAPAKASTLPPKPQPAAPASGEHVSSKERSLREAILARKRSRKDAPSPAELPQALAEQDIEGLFASARLESPSGSQDSEAIQFPFDPPPPDRHSDSSMVPSLSNPSSATQLPQRPTFARMPSSFNTELPASGPRPKASDLETEPVSPSAAFVPSGRPLFIPDPSLPTRVVIELDPEDYEPDIEPPVSASRAPSPLSQRSSSSSKAASRTTQLADAERRIKAMYEEIARKELLKKKNKASINTYTTSTADTPSPSAPTLQPSSADATPDLKANTQLREEHDALMAEKIVAESISQNQEDIYPKIDVIGTPEESAAESLSQGSPLATNNLAGASHRSQLLDKQRLQVSRRKKTVPMLR